MACDRLVLGKSAALRGRHRTAPHSPSPSPVSHQTHRTSHWRASGPSEHTATVGKGDRITDIHQPLNLTVSTMVSLKRASARLFSHASPLTRFITAMDSHQSEPSRGWAGCLGGSGRLSATLRGGKTSGSLHGIAHSCFTATSRRSECYVQRTHPQSHLFRYEPPARCRCLLGASPPDGSELSRPERRSWNPHGHQCFHTEGLPEIQRWFALCSGEVYKTNQEMHGATSQTGPHLLPRARNKNKL